MKLWTARICNADAAVRMGVPVVNITVKSGEKAFAPTWDMVGKVKDINHPYDADCYTEDYIDLMECSMLENAEQWDDLLAMDEVAIACYCHEKVFCHRHLLKDILFKEAMDRGIDFNYMGEVQP